jgi:glycosyltransferase involved in cell wall biosynthesis
MHIAYYSPTWHSGANPSGVVTYVRGMRDELQRQGHRVSVLTGDCDAPAENVYPVLPSFAALARSWVRSRLFPAQHEVLRWGEILAASLAQLHRHSPVDVFEMEESFGWFGAIAARLGVPVVVKLHGPAFVTLLDEERGSPFAAAKIEAEGTALRTAKVITSPSKRTLDATLAHYRLAPSIAARIANPLSLPPGAPVWNLDTCDRRIVLFVGRFDRLKGADLMLKAFARLLASYPELRLVFVGPDLGIRGDDGRLVHMAEMTSRLFTASQSKQVTATGALSAEAVCSLRAEAFVTVIASRRENQSYTLVEAMMQGCPIVASDTGGQSEAVRDGVRGLLVPVGDEGELAARIRELLEDPPKAARLGREARSYALAEHAPREVAARTLEVYRGAIAMAAGTRHSPRSLEAWH